MKFSPFALEDWFDRYEHRCKYNLGSSNCAGVSMREVLEMSGESIDLDKFDLVSGPVEGTEELRSAISTWYSNTAPDEIFVTCSSTEAIFLLSTALLKAGDSAVVMFPEYPSLYQLAEDCGIDVRRWRLRHENKFNPDLDELRGLADASTKLIILNNPHNPTGQILEAAELGEVVSIASRVGARVWSDEVFRGITVDGYPRTPSIRDIDQGSIATGSMSKAFGMSGLRIGWIAAPREVLGSIRNTRYYTTVCPPNIDQAIAAIAHRHRNRMLERNQAVVDRNYAVLLEWMEKHEGIFDWAKPQGGPVTFPRFVANVDVDKFCRELVEEHSVLIAPGGYAFDSSGFIRIGYGEALDFKAGLEIVSKAISRIVIGQV